MSGVFDQVATSKWSYATGTATTVTVPAGKNILSINAYSAAGGTLTITPGGANQNNSAGGAIPIPAGVGFGFPLLGQLGGGTVLVFSGTTSFFVEYMTSGVG